MRRRSRRRRGAGGARAAARSAGGAGRVVVPPGSSPIPGTTTAPAAPAQPVPRRWTGAAVTPGATRRAGRRRAARCAACRGCTATGGQIVLSPPGRIPRRRRVRTPCRCRSPVRRSFERVADDDVQPCGPARASRAGGQLHAHRRGRRAFTQQVDAAAGRIDIAIVRTGDPTGVAGTGLLAAVLFDAVGGGPANLSVTGAATGPWGTPCRCSSAPCRAVTVR